MGDLVTILELAMVPVFFVHSDYIYLFKSSGCLVG